MQRTYQEKTLINYGEILANSIQEKDYAGKHIIIFTNQRYYERFFEKLQRLFSKASIDWYVCTNLVYSNTIQELMDALRFLNRFSSNEDHLFLAFGNEGVIQLTGFLHRNTAIKSHFWVIPVSLRAYSQALVSTCSIFGKPTEMMMTTKVLANRIFLDQTIVQRQVDGKLVDLQMFIRTGIVCDYTFLQTLYRNFPSKKQLENTAFTALVEPVTIFYQNFEEEISNFGKIFETAFYLTENGHLLSESMKRFFGLLFHLFWAIQWSIEDFQIENFLKWLHRLGFPIFLPRQISLAEYLQNVLDRKSVV